MDKIRIAICTDGIYPHGIGGMQRHSRKLIDELVKYKDVELVIIHPHSVRVFDGIDNLTQKFLDGIDKKKVYLRESYKYSRRVFEELDNYELDIVYSQGLSIWYKAGKIKQPLVINPHGLEPYQGLTVKERFVGRPFRRVFNKLFKRANR